MPFVSPGSLALLYDVCIVGAGPAGLVSALMLHERGLRVLILEAGGKSPVPGSPDILLAHLRDTNAHGPTDIVSASAFGGSSHWWGGRVVPLDPVDFRQWPINHAELEPLYQSALKMLDCDTTIFPSAPGAFGSLRDFQADTSESWTQDRVLSHRWASRFDSGKGPDVLLHARVAGLNRTNRQIESLRVLFDGRLHTARAKRFVLAGGGLGSLRLLLLMQREHPDLFGGKDGPLGRGYMGHLTGSISNLAFDRPVDAKAFFFTHNGRFVTRRRIMPRAATVTEKDICNIAFWLDGPRNDDPSHGSAASSVRYLAAGTVRAISGRSRGTMFSDIYPHLKNVSRSPFLAAYGLSEAAWHLARGRLTAFAYRPAHFRPAAPSSWRMVYHAEQAPDMTNRISLSNERDSVGLPKLDINFRFSQHCVDSVVRAHDCLDADLHAAGAGSLRYTTRDLDSASAVMASARDGYHQLGGAVISDTPKSGVVDRNCDVHGLGNLSVVAGCVFPSGGQANPTLTVMALACRLADRIASTSRIGHA